MIQKMVYSGIRKSVERRRAHQRIVAGTLIVSFVITRGYLLLNYVNRRYALPL